MQNNVYRLFPALRNKNYSLYFWGQITSLVGTWLQIVAQGWLVLELTKSPFLIGVVATSQTLPTFFFALFGGVVVDRFDKRKVIIGTQIASMILALILGVLTLTKLVTIEQIIILSLLLGLVNAIDAPARQAFTVDIVGKEDLPSAIALNSATFNGARVIGPSFAGILIGLVGTGGAFLANGLTFLAVIFALVSMKVTSPPCGVKSGFLREIRDGVVYAYTQPILRTLLLFTTVISIFAWSYITMLPLIAQNSFGQDAIGVGYLFAISGLGALAASVVVSAWGKKFSSMRFIIFGAWIYAVSIIGFSYTNQLLFAYIFLFFTGFGILLSASMLNTTIQSNVADEFRGRVMSLYVLNFMGLFSVGNFQIGVLSEWFSPEVALRIDGVVVFVAGVLLFFVRTRVRDAQQAYLQHTSRF
jgi:MFS family permease